MYMLNNAGDRPVLSWRCVDVVYLNIVYALCPLSL